MGACNGYPRHRRPAATEGHHHGTVHNTRHHHRPRRRQNRPPCLRADQHRRENLRQTTAPRRSRTARNLRVHAGPRQRSHGRRSTQHHRRPAHRRGPRLRLHGRRPPRPSHTKSSRSLPWTIKNRPPGCIHHRRHRPHHAAHTAGSRPRRRDTSSAEDARRIPRRHHQRRHPNEKQPSQRAHTDSPRTRARLCRRDSLAHAGCWTRSSTTKVRQN